MHCSDYAHPSPISSRIRRYRHLAGYAGISIAKPEGKTVRKAEPPFFLERVGEPLILDPKPGRPTQVNSIPFPPVRTEFKSVKFSLSLPNKCIIVPSFVPLRARMEIMVALLTNCRRATGRAPTWCTPGLEA